MGGCILGLADDGRRGSGAREADGRRAVGVAEEAFEGQVVGVDARGREPQGRSGRRTEGLVRQHRREDAARFLGAAASGPVEVLAEG